MKNKFKLAICLALSSAVLLGTSNENFLKNDSFRTISFASNPSSIKKSSGGIWQRVYMDLDFLQAIQSVKVNNIEYQKTDNNRFFDNQKYHLNLDEDGSDYSIQFHGLNPGDKICLKTDKKTLNFTVSDPKNDAGVIDVSSINEASNTDTKPNGETPKKKDEKIQTNYIKRSVGGFASDTIFLDTNFVNSIKGVTVNGRDFTEVKNSRPKDNQYYLITGENGPDEYGIRFPLLNEGDRVTIKNDKVSLSFTVTNTHGYGEIIKKDSISVAPLSAIPSKKEEPSGGEDVSPKEISFTYVSEAFKHNILKLTSGAKFDKKKLEKLVLNGKDQTEVSAPISIFGNGNYAFSSDGELCIERLNDNDSLSITYDGKEYNYLYKNNKLVDNKDKKDVTYQIRLVGNFDSLLVGQEKIDGLSAGSYSVSSNPNAVNVEYTDKENPDKGDWKKLDDRGNEFRTVKAVIDDEESGIKANFANGSVILSGSPKKAGTFKIKILATDIRDKKVESNEVEVEVHKLGEENLEELLAKGRFIQTQDKKYMWNMSPWKVTEFNKSDNLVNVPKDLKAWFGSHESGTYGELGKETLEKTNQTLVVGEGTNLTIKNMKILGSVKIIVKDGGILNLDDSVVFGKIEVSNGGKLDVNYNTRKKEITSGASIWGQVVLKDGAILGNSSIYSNTNYAAQGKLVNINSKPVIRVEGKARIEGEVSIRGDEQATKGESGQPALEIGPNGVLDISENSSLNLFGGGAMPLTSVGGDALKLNGGKVTGKGRLVAVAGAGQGRTGGAGISGFGTISVSQAYIRGGNSLNLPGKAIGSDKIKFESTKGLTIDGKIPTSYDKVIAEDYWNETKRISPDILNRINKILDENKNTPLSKNQNSNTENTQPEKGDGKKGEENNPTPKPKEKEPGNTNPLPKPKEKEPGNTNPLSKPSVEENPSLDNKGKGYVKPNPIEETDHNSYADYDSTYLVDKFLNESESKKFDQEKYKKLKKAYERSAILSRAASLLLEKCPKKTRHIRKELISLIEKSEKLRKEAEIMLKKMDPDFKSIY